VGEWIPEPLPEPTGGAIADPADRVALDESVSMAFLVVLESMTPAERVAFIRPDVFRHPFAEVAEIVGRSQAACRQLASSARRRVRETQQPATPTAEMAGVVREFKRAWEATDIHALIDCSTPMPSRSPMAVESSTRSTRWKAASRARNPASTSPRRAFGLSLLETTVNGQPGLVVQQDGVTVTVYAFAVADARITRIWAIRNPKSSVRGANPPVDASTGQRSRAQIDPRSSVHAQSVRRTHLLDHLAGKMFAEVHFGKMFSVGSGVVASSGVRTCGSLPVRTGRFAPRTGPIPPRSATFSGFDDPDVGTVRRTSISGSRCNAGFRQLLKRRNGRDGSRCGAAGY
jgi:hypothetical protein